MDVNVGDVELASEDLTAECYVQLHRPIRTAPPSLRWRRISRTTFGSTIVSGTLGEHACVYVHTLLCPQRALTGSSDKSLYYWTRLTILDDSRVQKDHSGVYI